MSQIAGYSKWTADGLLDGTLLPRDGTISTTVPGSGELRLVAFDGPGGNGRVHVALSRCPVLPPVCDGGCADAAATDGADASSSESGAPDVGPPPMTDTCMRPPTQVSSLTVVMTTATSVVITFLNGDADGKAVESYDIHYRIGTLTEAEFESADPGPFVTPGEPDAPMTVEVDNLKPGTSYVVGVRSVDHCSQRSAVATVSFKTDGQKFTQLSGCFVATAAYGSALEPEVAALRRARDRLRASSPLFATATDLYYRSGPAAAAVVAESDLARGLARRVIGPFAGLAEALDAFSSSNSPAR